MRIQEHIFDFFILIIDGPVIKEVFQIGHTLNLEFLKSREEV